MSVFLFKKKPKTCLGIDIGTSLVKVVELEISEGRYQLKNYATYSLMEHLKKAGYQIGSESAKISNEDMADVIIKTLKEAKIESREACLSVPVYSSFSTLIDFPAMSAKEIAAAVPLEARKYVPVPVSEVVLDWSIIESPGQQESQQVLLVAVPKEVIINYNQIVRLVGLRIKAIEEETFSLSRSLVGNDKSAILLIDAGARSINVSIVDGGYIRGTHNLEMGGLKISKSIAQEMSLGLEEAERLKKEVSTNQSADEKKSQIKGSINSSLGVIALEIKKILDSYQTKYTRRIEKCVLAGGSVQLFGFADYLTNKLGLEVSVGQPFARVSYPSLLQPAIKELGPALAVAIGLAMRE